MNFKKITFTVLFTLNVFYALAQFNWSPDGNKLTYSEIANMKNIDVKHPPVVPRFNIYQVNADGTGNELLAEDGGFPSYSPDGKNLVFNTTKKDSSQIYILNLQTRVSTPITHTPLHYLAVRFSPDGKKLCYRRRKKNDESFYCNSDGTGVIQLTKDTSIRNYDPFKEKHFILL